jgi:hypothetical protein
MDVSGILSTLAVMGMKTLRQNIVMGYVANRDYEQAVQSMPRNGTVNISIPSAITAVDVTPAATPPSTASVTPTSVPITLDKWKEAPFYLSDQDLVKVQAGIIPMQAAEAGKAIANAIENDLMSAYKKVGNYAGTAGTTPFATDTAAYRRARKIAQDRLMPANDRYVILNTDAEENVLGLRAFTDASMTGDTNTMINAIIGRKLGALWVPSQLVPTHTAGTITTGLITKAATVVAAGLKTFVATTAASTGACALVEGDVIAIAGHTRTYALTAAATQASAASDVTITISEGLEAALAGSEAITVVATHAVNMLVHRDAVAFAMAPLIETNVVPGLAYMQSIIDEESGFSLRVELTREHKRWRWSYDAMWGKAVPRPELGVRIAG